MKTSMICFFFLSEIPKLQTPFEILAFDARDGYRIRTKETVHLIVSIFLDLSARFSLNVCRVRQILQTSHGELSCNDGRMRLVV